MNAQPDPSPRLPSSALAVLGLVMASAALYFGYQVSLGLQLDDSGHLETPLALALTGQIRDGFGTLYGPFSGSRPLVLIHAPFYYRLAALLAWPLVRLGTDPLLTGLYAGRLLSLLSIFAGMWAAYRIARLDGAPRGGGVLAILLIAASPVLGCLSVTVRPDTLAMALQTFGILVVLRALRDGSPRFSSLALAYSAFALAFCTKQHNIVALGVSSLLLLGAWWRGRAKLVPIVGALGLSLGIVVGYFVLEDMVTGGMSTQSVFVLPGGPFRAINYASPSHVVWVGSLVVKKSLGLLALAFACFAFGRRLLPSRPLDAALLAYLAAELLFLIPLCIYNAGAADNYALSAIVFLCLIVGRAADGLLSRTPGLLTRLALCASAGLLLAGDVRLVAISVAARSEHAATLNALLTDPDLPIRGADERYFAYASHLNRLHGRPSLAHDEWLYRAYESVHAAEPREAWLRSALTGPVRQVIVVAPSGTHPFFVPGIAEPLPQLGYRLVAERGSYSLWDRGDAGTPRRTSERDTLARHSIR